MAIIDLSIVDSRKEYHMQIKLADLMPENWMNIARLRKFKIQIEIPP